MLVEKQEDLSGKIVTVLLLSGQEIIGKLVATTDKEYIVSKPRMPVQSPDGKGIGLGPILATGDANAVHNFERDKVVLVVPTVPELAAHYQQVTSGVLTPNKPSIIT